MHAKYRGYVIGVMLDTTETMFSTKEIQAAIVEATRALGYSKLRSY